ncbi:MAG: hypothetical protein A49_24310 [Methyloceanibacter sp.]|nr:MAG: hypothetical protein A49_24310 [Methyloceanibacter sp.]
MRSGLFSIVSNVECRNAERALTDTNTFDRRDLMTREEIDNDPARVMLRAFGIGAHLWSAIADWEG